MDINEQVMKDQEEMIAIRRMLHLNPELSNQEFKTTAFIRSQLKEYGIEIEECGLKTGVSAIIRGSKPGKTIAIREDIDALPIKENTGLSFSSIVDGISHACGHDLHITVMLYCAKLLNDYKEELSGNVRLLFQPAEENGTGALEMIKCGCISRDPKADLILSVHTSPDVTAGCIGIKKGPINAGFDIVKITVKGKGGHGAHPYKCVDPIVVSAYLITQLQTIISRENPAVKPAVFTIGTIHGGNATNIIPDEVVMTGNLRSFYPESRDHNLKAIQRISKYCCESMNATAEVELLDNKMPPISNDYEIVEQIIKAANMTIGEENIVSLELPSPGSDDFSCYLDYCPGCYFMIGTGNDDKRSTQGLHNASSIFDERGIFTGVKVLTQYVLNTLKIT